MAEALVDDRLLDEGTGSVAARVGKGRRDSASAGAGGAVVSAVRSRRSEFDLHSFTSVRVGTRGRKSLWGGVPTDTRAFALPADKPLTDHERGLIENRRRKAGKRIRGPLATPELLWLVRHRDTSRTLTGSRHKIPSGLVNPETGKPISAVTLIQAEKEAKIVLTEYWLSRGELVLKE